MNIAHATTPPGTPRQGGFSLIEVLISAVVMGSGLAGLAALLMMAVSGTQGAADRTAAALLADAMVARIRISPTVTAAYTQAPQAEPPNCNAADACDANQFAAAGVAAWHDSLAAQLPAGRGVVCRDSTPDDGTPSSTACDGELPLVVKVFWTSRAGGPTGRTTRVVH